MNAHAEDPVSAHAAISTLHVEDRRMLAPVDPELLSSLGLPDAAVSQRRAETFAAVQTALSDMGHAPAVRVSPLGPGWSSDIDVAVRPDATQLRGRGWLCLDDFLRRIGSEGEGRWLVVDTDAVPARALGVADFAPAVASFDVERVIVRARKRGRVELRDVLELRHATRLGLALPADEEVVSAAADIEAGLGGERLRRFTSGRAASTMVPLVSGRHRRRAASVRHLLRPRYVVALGGVDGAGKSSLTKGLLDYLQPMSIEPDVIWTRPGMRMDWIDPIVKWVRRSGDESTPTVARVATGEPVDAASRSGAVGWLWTMLVTGTFLVDVWTRHLRSSGLKIYDRHLLDALVTLDFVYDGVDLRVQRTLISRLLPKADASFYLSIDADTAAARKPGDSFGRHAVEQQLIRYDRELSRRGVEVDGIRRLDATAPPDQLVATVVTDILGGGR